MERQKSAAKRNVSQAMEFILLFGVVSLLSDLTHEAASSIRGIYYSLLGASAATIGFVSGLGEMIGYSLRYLFGRITDRTKQYWPMTILGYALDVLSVPLLALVHEDGWMVACALLVVQRLGKAIKKPAKNTLVSFAASQEGAGISFGLSELLDQIGAFLGPVLLYVVLLFRTEGTTFERYAFCFAILLIPALATMVMLFYTRTKFPNPETFEVETEPQPLFHLTKNFSYYIAGISLFAFGFLDYSLILLHVSGNFSEVSSAMGETAQIISSGNVPLLYAGAMLVDAVSAMVFGMLYDRKGFSALVISTLLSSPFAVFVFLGDSIGSLLTGLALWGIGMGAQESILKAAVSRFVPKQSRATGYGIFECAFGLFWFLGSWLLGVLYDYSLPVMVTVSVAAQVLAVPFFMLSSKETTMERG